LITGTFGHLSDQKSLLTGESQQKYLNTQYSVVHFNCTQSTAGNIKHDSVQQVTHYQQA